METETENINSPQEAVQKTFIAKIDNGEGGKTKIQAATIEEAWENAIEWAKPKNKGWFNADKLKVIDGELYTIIDGDLQIVDGTFHLSVEDDNHIIERDIDEQIVCGDLIEKVEAEQLELQEAIDRDSDVWDVRSRCRHI